MGIRHEAKELEAKELNETGRAAEAHLFVPSSNDDGLVQPEEVDLAALDGRARLGTHALLGIDLRQLLEEGGFGQVLRLGLFGRELGALSRGGWRELMLMLLLRLRLELVGRSVLEVRRRGGFGEVGGCSVGGGGAERADGRLRPTSEAVRSLSGRGEAEGASMSARQGYPSTREAGPTSSRCLDAGTR